MSFLNEPPDNGISFYPALETRPRRLQITVPGEPVPQNVGKVGRWKSKDGREGTVFRQPSKVIRYKLEVQERMVGALTIQLRHCLETGGPVFKEAVSLTIEAVFPLPLSAHRKNAPPQRRRHTGRYGNCDNLTKAIADAGEGILWLDDGQIAVLHVEKWIGAQAEAPYVKLIVEDLC